MNPQPAPTPPTAAPQVRRKPRHFIWIAAALLLAGMAAAFVWNSRVLPIRSVEVRPLTDESGSPWLAGAITEEIVAALRPATQPSAEPAFRAVLEGSVTRSGGRIRVNARLTRADGHRYWARTFERPITEIAGEVAAAVVPQSRRKTSRHKPSAKAYELCLQARQLLPRSLPGSIAGFDRATQADPEFGLSWAWLAIATESLVEQGGGRPNELLPGARDAAERAVTLDPESAETHLALGIVRLQYDWDWESAQREFERALQIDPSNPLALRWRERWLEAMNRAPVPPLELADAPHDPDTARRYLAEADEMRSRSYVTPASFVLAAHLAHDADSLFHWLDVAYEERSVHLPYLLRSPALPQSDPRLQDLIRRLKLPTNP